MHCIVQRALISLVAGAALAACTTARSEPEFLVTPDAASRPFSPAVRASGLLFLAGKLGTDSAGKLASGGIQAETRQAIRISVPS